MTPQQSEPADVVWTFCLRRLPAAALLLVLLLGLVAECDDNWDDGVIHASPTSGPLTDARYVGPSTEDGAS